MVGHRSSRTKSALTTITECLAAQLDADRANVKAAVFYPSGRGLLDTGLWTSDHNRPKQLERERPRTTPAMTVAELRAKGMPVQPSTSSLAWWSTASVRIAS